MPAIPSMFIGLAVHYLVQISSKYFILLWSTNGLGICLPGWKGSPARLGL